MGLDEVYTIVRGNILMMNPLPSMDQAFSLLIQEEKQREFRPTVQWSSLNANVVTNKRNLPRNFKTNYAGGNNNSGGNSFIKAVVMEEMLWFVITAKDQVILETGVISYMVSLQILTGHLTIINLTSRIIKISREWGW